MVPPFQPGHFLLVAARNTRGWRAIDLDVRSEFENTQEYRRETLLHELHTKVRFDAPNIGLEAGVKAVYGCNAGLPHDVPCPDYTATVVFHGNAESEPPTLQPVRDAQGQVIIDLAAAWEPDEGWVVRAGRQPGVVAFAVNTAHQDVWSGPIFIPLIPPIYSSDAEAGDRIEIYAADVDATVVGKPLANNRID